MPARAAVVTQALQQLGLWERRNDRAGTLSRGMQQRLALARARLHDPELLLLDEPTTGLDVMSAREVRRELAEIAGKGTTIFLTTHNMEEAEQLCARVAVIRQGKLVAEGEPSALLAASGHEVLISEPGSRRSSTGSAAAMTCCRPSLGTTSCVFGSSRPIRQGW